MPPGAADDVRSAAPEALVMEEHRMQAASRLSLRALRHGCRRGRGRWSSATWRSRTTWLSMASALLDQRGEKTPQMCVSSADRPDGREVRHHALFTQEQIADAKSPAHILSVATASATACSMTVTNDVPVMDRRRHVLAERFGGWPLFLVELRANVGEFACSVC